MRIAIMGAGSMGTILGAYIAKGGCDITLIDSYKEHVDALNKNGAHIVGTVDFTQPVKAITPAQMDGIYDLVLFMVKQTNNEDAFKQLKPHLNDKSTIVTLQNGLPERAVEKEFGAERTMGCPVGWGATFKGPGVSELTSATDKLTFELGRLDGKITPKVEEVKKILELMCTTVVTENLMGSRWTKILVNSTFSGMSSALACTFGDVLDGEKSLLVVKYIANECIKIAKAKNIQMEPIQGFDLGKLVGFSTIEQRDANTPVYQKMFGPHRLLRASMLQDLEKGRRCEISAINGVVCEMGDECGVDTPANDQVVSIVSQIEQGKLKLGNHIDLFKIPDTI